MTENELDSAIGGKYAIRNYYCSASYNPLSYLVTEVSRDDVLGQ